MTPGPNNVPPEVIASYFSYLLSRFSSPSSYVPVLINKAPDFSHAGLTVSVNLLSVIILIPTESSFYPKGSEIHFVEMIAISFQAFKLFCSQFSGGLWGGCYSQSIIWLNRGWANTQRNTAQMLYYVILFRFLVIDLF